MCPVWGQEGSVAKDFHLPGWGLGLRGPFPCLLPTQQAHTFAFPVLPNEPLWAGLGNAPLFTAPRGGKNEFRCEKSAL